LSRKKSGAVVIFGELQPVNTGLLRAKTFYLLPEALKNINRESLFCLQNERAAMAS